MKKYLLTAFAVMPMLAFGQRNTPQVSPEMNVPVPAQSRVLSDKAVGGGTMHQAPFGKRASAGNNYGVDFIEVGQTRYDLQTNASIGRRILLHSDGSVSVTWTTAASATFTDRGSGYNYSDGTGFMAATSDRIENVRLGWPSIGVLPDGKEYVIAHDADLGGFRITKNQSKGNTNWTVSGPILTYSGGQRPIWNRAVNSGNTIHLIGNFSDSSSSGDPRVITLNGVAGPMVYSRSQDGGVVWDKENVLLPDYDSTRILRGGGDNYSIDVRGSVVAIVSGGLGEDVALWKSTDNGSTFTKTIIDSFPYAPFPKRLMINPLTSQQDTPFTNDGTVDVLIDENDAVHVFWGLGRVTDDDSTDERFFLFPATNQIVYWNENTGIAQVIASAVDENNNDVLDIEPATYNALRDGQIPTGLNRVARTGSTSLATMPSAAIDDDGTIYLTYSAPRELDVDFDLANFRDVYVVFSMDGGATWSDPQNLTQAPGKEDAFPAIARKANGFLHLTWQQDEIPGTNLQNNPEGGNSHSVVDNSIMYAAIPVSKIKNNEIGLGIGLGIYEQGLKPAEVFEVSQNYPNPFVNETNVVVYLSESADLNLTITNLMGQTVRSYDMGKFNAGNHELVIDGSGLSAGVYTYTISSGSSKASNKMIVR